MIKYIFFKKKLIAIVLRKNFKTSGIKFFTPTNSFQQLGYMNRKKNYIITSNDVMSILSLGNLVLQGMIQLRF